jgi:hypothetical protein
MKTDVRNSYYKSPQTPNYRNMTPSTTKSTNTRGYSADRFNREEQPFSTSLITQTPKTRPLTSSQWSNPKYYIITQFTKNEFQQFSSSFSLNE